MKSFVFLTLSLYIPYLMFKQKILTIITMEGMSVVMVSIYFLSGNSILSSIFVFMIFVVFMVLESVFGMSCLLSSHRGSSCSFSNFNFF